MQLKMWRKGVRYGSVEQQEKAARGCLVTFYKNGDTHFKGLTTSVSQRQFRTFETLLRWLDEKISTTTGIRHIFELPHGYQIIDITQFKTGYSYVVSSTPYLRKLPYGNTRESYWINRPLSTSGYRRLERHLLRDEDTEREVKATYSHSYPVSRTSSNRSYPWSDSTRPPNASGASKQVDGKRQMITSRRRGGSRVLTIISNTNKNSKQKVR